MAKQKVGVLMGGTSAEREVSLNSGECVASALERAGHEIERIDVGTGVQLLRELERTQIDVAFLALHGRHGEDGCVQGVLEMSGIPYTGSSVMSSALAMDKLKSKELFRLHNVPTPPYYILNSQTASALEESHGSFGFPVVVKPRREGSSIGVSVARNLRQLATSVRQALTHDDSVLVERFIEGREVAVGILNGRILGAVEIATSSALYDYEAKYESSDTQYFIPARLPQSRIRGVLNYAERAANALGCTGAVRVDLIVTEGHNEYVLEVNTIPGMTDHSLLPMIAAAAGYDFPALCGEVLAGAVCHVATTKRASQTAVADGLESRVAETAPNPVVAPLRVAV